MTERWLEIDCRKEPDPGERILEWWEHCRKANSTFSIISQVGDEVVWTIVELPDAKRLTSIGEEEVLFSDETTRFHEGRGSREALSFGIDLGQFTDLRQFASISKARAYVEAVFLVLERDFCDDRYAHATVEGIEGWCTPSNSHPSENTYGSFCEPQMIDAQAWDRECGVIRAALKEFATRCPRYDDFVFFEVSAYQSFELQYTETRCNDDYIRGFLPGAQTSTIHDFRIKNQARFLLLPFSPVPNSELVMRDGPPDFETFHREHPNAPGILRCSRVGFNEQQDQAIVEFQNHIDSSPLSPANPKTCTTPIQSLLLLERADGRWSVASSFHREQLIASRLVSVPDVDLFSPRLAGPIGPRTLKAPVHRLHLHELEGYESTTEALEDFSLSENESLLGIYRNPRGEPLTIVFSDRGLRFINHWKNLFVPYRIMQSFEQDSGTSVKLSLYDGRHIEFEITGFIESPNHKGRISDASWFSWDLQDLIRQHYCAEAFDWMHRTIYENRAIELTVVEN